MLTTIDFLVGEKNQPGNKIGECMHDILEVIHKFSPWLLLWLEKRCILSSLLASYTDPDFPPLLTKYVQYKITVYSWMVTFYLKPAFLL